MHVAHEEVEVVAPDLKPVKVAELASDKKSDVSAAATAAKAASEQIDKASSDEAATDILEQMSNATIHPNHGIHHEGHHGHGFHSAGSTENGHEGNYKGHHGRNHRGHGGHHHKGSFQDAGGRTDNGESSSLLAVDSEHKMRRHKKHHGEHNEEHHKSKRAEHYKKHHEEGHDSLLSDGEQKESKHHKGHEQSSHQHKKGEGKEHHNAKHRKSLLQVEDETDEPKLDYDYSEEQKIAEDGQGSIDGQFSLLEVSSKSHLRLRNSACSKDTARKAASTVMSCANDNTAECLVMGIYIGKSVACKCAGIMESCVAEKVKAYGCTDQLNLIEAFADRKRTDFLCDDADGPKKSAQETINALVESGVDTSNFDSYEQPLELAIEQAWNAFDAAANRVGFVTPEPFEDFSAASVRA
jgi:hypothetical protein